MFQKQRVLSTGKPFHYNTSKENRNRINNILELLRKTPLTVEQILAKNLMYSGKQYKLKDLNYDIRKGYFKLGKPVGCQICNHPAASLHCFHCYLCIDCEGGGRFRCKECNPRDELYHIEYMGLEPQIVFSN